MPLNGICTLSLAMKWLKKHCLSLLMWFILDYIYSWDPWWCGPYIYTYWWWLMVPHTWWWYHMMDIWCRWWLMQFSSFIYYFRSPDYTLSIYGGPYSWPIRATQGVWVHIPRGFGSSGSIETLIFQFRALLTVIDAVLHLLTRFGADFPAWAAGAMRGQFT